jgi:ketosteroid isomerase-like protein
VILKPRRLAFAALAFTVIAGAAVAEPVQPFFNRSSEVSEDIAPIVAADERRRAALNANDADALGALLSEDLVYIHSNGLVDRRQAYIDRVRAGPGRYRNLTVKDFRVRRDGGAAICDGEVRFDHGVEGGPTIKVHAHFLAIWKLEGGAWRLAGYASPAIPGR